MEGGQIGATQYLRANTLVRFNLSPRCECLQMEQNNLNLQTVQRNKLSILHVPTDFVSPANPSKQQCLRTSRSKLGGHLWTAISWALPLGYPSDGVLQ